VCHDRTASLLVFALHLFHHHIASRAQIDYVALALGAFASWVGLPGPGEPLLIAAAIIAAKHKLDISGGSPAGSGVGR
jgi:membrane protein DedA with SNARE-associated domain